MSRKNLTRFIGSFIAYNVEEKKIYSSEELFGMGILLSPRGTLVTMNEKIGKSINNFRIMFASGAHDSTKSPIHEEDICTFDVDVSIDNEIQSSYETHGVMKYVRGTGSFILYFEGVFSGATGNIKNVRKVGNAYTHPELLKKIYLSDEQE